MKKSIDERDWLEEARKFLRYAEEAMRRAETLRVQRPPKPPRSGKRPPKDEGGEPMPAIPRPKPKPLEGGAAAPIEKERGLKKKVSRGPRVKPDPANVSEAGSVQFL